MDFYQEMADVASEVTADFKQGTVTLNQAWHDHAGRELMGPAGCRRSGGLNPGWGAVETIFKRLLERQGQRARLPGP